MSLLLKGDVCIDTETGKKVVVRYAAQGAKTCVVISPFGKEYVTSVSNLQPLEVRTPLPPRQVKHSIIVPVEKTAGGSCTAGAGDYESPPEQVWCNWNDENKSHKCVGFMNDGCPVVEGDGK
jgi:hypothetical protein